jgi:hypothetical protein
MRQLTGGTKLALTLTGATAIATMATSTAFANDAHWTEPSLFQATTLDLRVPLNPDVFHAFLDAKLDRVEAAMNALRAKVSAIPSTTVLTGMERRAAKARLAKAAFLGHVLDNLPDSGLYAPTATEAAQIARIQAALDAIVAKLKTLLANVPAVTPTTTTLVTKSLDPRTALALLGTRDHVCDGHWDGWHDGTRFDRTRWDWWHH